MSLMPLFFLGGAILALKTLGGGGTRSSASTPTGAGGAPAPTGGAPTGGSPAPASACVYGPDEKDLTKLPDTPFWGSFKVAMLSESDPAELDALAKSFDAVCQRTAAEALRSKARALRSAGVPSGFDPMKMPVPAMASTPMPKFDVPEAAPGAINLMPELSPDLPLPPRAGYRSLPSTQWWTGPALSADNVYSITKAITGDGMRFQELIAANPEKATVVVPGFGATFVTLQPLEQVRLPKAWNIFVDQMGKTTGDGTAWPEAPSP